MAAHGLAPVLVVILNTLTLHFSYAEVLTPPYFNLAQEREIYASATCGETVAVPEWYCRLTGSTGEERVSGPQSIRGGQYCDFCNPSVPGKDHPAEYAIDGTERWWQSPPLSRGMSFNEVNLTINFQQEFHVAYVYIKMANSPRPGVWALERSVDFGKTWKPWQYFADTPSDCYKFFGVQASTSIVADDSVICTTEFSKIVPLENGEIVVSLVNGRPNAMNFSYSETLQQWTIATNVRLRLLRTKTLLGHLMAVARQDPTVTRRYYYSIKDISVGGRCVCNGHATTCDRADPLMPNKLICNCQHNTCGDQCDRCCPGYIQKPWQRGRMDRIFMCEPCECYGHSNECIYDADVDANRQSVDIHGNRMGGGVCQNCRDNTMGINCNECVPGYYNPYGVPLDDKDACIPCDCVGDKYTGTCDPGTGRCHCSEAYTGDLCDRCSFGYHNYPNCVPCDCHINGTVDATCTIGSGQCPCKDNYIGQRCDICQFGYYNFPECLECQCSGIGVTSNVCDKDTGQCPCHPNYTGMNCESCADGYYNYPECLKCDCEPLGTEAGICNNVTGECLCKTNFLAPRCDSCNSEYYGYPTCGECGCGAEGSQSTVCREDGQCPCKNNFAGSQCTRCSSGFYKYPACDSCNCDLYGSYGRSCMDLTGQCDCKPTYEGLTCGKCKEGFYNYPNCEECNCNPAGAKEIPGFPLGGCGDVIKGLLCDCKENVQGRICDQCKPGFFNLQRNNPRGCEDCNCYAPGTESGLDVCNSLNGQCLCKADVGGRRCDTCRDGFYGLNEVNPFGCLECKCDAGGSLSSVCDKRTGQCRCKPRVKGKHCESPDLMHFYPTLQQMIYELEDGRTPEGSQIRYGFDNITFPGFSWRGYAILTYLQPKVVMDLDILRPSLYRVIYRYINLNEKTITGEVTLTPDSSNDVIQKSEVHFLPTEQPKFVTVGSNEAGVNDFVLNPGKWMISVDIPDIILLDYMVLVPQAYYEATVLQETVTRPCTVPNDGGPCLVYNYPDISVFPTADGKDGYVIDADGNKIPTQVFSDKVILNELGLDALSKLNDSQKMLELDLYIADPGKYVIVVNYFALDGEDQDLNVTVATSEEDITGRVDLYDCHYSVLCRQVVKGEDNMPISPYLNGSTHIVLTGNDNINLAISSVVAIPYDEWTLGYIRPTIICIRVNGVCIGSEFFHPAGSVRLEFEDPPNEDLRVYGVDMPVQINDRNVGLVKLNSTHQEVTVEGLVPVDSPYIMVVHFFMPSEVLIDIPVTVQSGDKIYKGIFQPKYCPGFSGCNSLIYFQTTDNHNVVDLTQGPVKVAFNNTSGREIWLDYLLLVPASSFSNNVLDLQPVDNSAAFLRECIGDGFQLISNSTFCLEGVFTLTTDFNNGALSCSCDIDGSLSFGCSEFGGQCKCRDNVIGRKCTHCRAGHYGFPNCRPCNCPYGTCHAVSGECVCPPRVTGKMCDECLPETYGYDQLVGCTDCDCDPNGVESGDLNCDQLSGQCQCKPNIHGRKCDSCVTGFHSFPYCDRCNCEIRGTREGICDDFNGACLCKENVAEPYCDRCEQGSFNLEPRNPKGCTHCFCFGGTQSCTSSEGILYWKLHKDMIGWDVTNVFEGSLREAGDIIAVLDAQNKTMDKDIVMYWIAPDSYLGNRVTSYGGKLSFGLFYTIPQDSISLMDDGPGVVLKGRNLTLVYYFPSELEPNSMHDLSVDLLEYKFVHSRTGASVTREQFMMVLVNLEEIQIRASYYDNVAEVRLMNVTLHTAAEDGDGAPAMSVEYCRCPVGYTGTSCESCAQGYYRARSTPFLGICVPCECNGHSGACDPITGKCLDCHGNTMGDHCELCLPGHYGDPAVESCTICSCPLALESNNFASSCNVYSGRLLSCDCEEGYTGYNCARCAPGYYGNPMEIGGGCTKCDCSDNIDMQNPYSCDVETGECKICENNSTGVTCELCKNWWYGDAITAKNCQPCHCDQCGSVSCDNSNGYCECKTSVVGPNCDRCADNYYGFDSCGGCTYCDCDMASNSSQCDDVTGQCPCQPGVTGQRCESCLEGYWNYDFTGCQKCNCESDGAVSCDVMTGKCRCLPGVTGDTCDRCMPRWILVPNQGCQSCDNCIHMLLDDMDFLELNMSGVSGNLASVSAGVTAIRRLEVINQTVADYTPKVSDVYNIYQNISLEIGALKNNSMSVVQMADDQVAESEGYIRMANNIAEEVVTFTDNSNDVETVAMNAETEARGAVAYVLDVVNTILAGIQVTNIDNYISQSQQLLEEILNITYNGMRDRAKKALDDALMGTGLDVVLLKSEPQNMMNATQLFDMGYKDLRARLHDLEKNGRDSVEDSMEAKNLVKKARNLHLAMVKLRLESIAQSKRNIDTALSMAEAKVMDSQMFLNSSRDDAQNLAELSTQMEAAINNLKDKEMELSDALNASESDKMKAEQHADSLVDQAKMLESVYTDTRETASNALRAAKAYSNITMAIMDAFNASQVAVVSAEAALGKSNGVGDASNLSKNRSADILESARLREERTQTELMERLADAEKSTQDVSALNNDVSAQLDVLQQGLLPLSDKADSIGVASQNVSDRAEDIQQKTRNTEAMVNDILSKLPEDRAITGRLANGVTKTNNDMNYIESQAQDVRDKLPRITELIDLVGVMSTTVKNVRNNVMANITALKEKIQLARATANMIRVGLEFQGNTTVALRNPPDFDESGSYTKLSMHVRTEHPNALLAYVGSEFVPDRPTPDYLALELRNGQPVFRFELGSGEAEIVSPLVITDNNWYRITAKRIGKIGTLIVSKEENSEIEEIEETGETTGTNTVLDLNPATSKFVLGGTPSIMRLPPNLSPEYFRGIMEDVSFDDNTMGLWNFVYGESNYVGAIERTVLKEVKSNGYSFDGQGYVILDRAEINFRPNSRVNLLMSIKTYAENGLIIYMGKDRDFLSLEMRDGKILFQYDLGSMPAVLITNKTYNDGQWHRISANRLDQDGRLQIDVGENAETIRGSSPGTLTSLAVLDDIFIGGYNDLFLPVRHVQPYGFDGCIKDVQFGSAAWDLINNKAAIGVNRGCPEKILRTASFAKNTAGYVAIPADSIGLNFDVTFRMKTTEANGLLMYTSDNVQTTVFSVSLSEGKIVLTSNPGDALTTIESTINTYNDGQWHYISIMKMGTKLTMNIDDQQMVERDAESNAEEILTERPVYFGGTDFTIPPDSVASDQSFTGCISDITINKRFVNLASIQKSNIRSASFGDCGMERIDKEGQPGEGEKTGEETVTMPMPGRCALPMEGFDLTGAGGNADGLMFGTKLYSHHEYTTLPGSVTIKSEFALEFKTTNSRGVLFYISAANHMDFLSLYMKDGRVVFSFDCGSGAGTITSTVSYNDGQWHKVNFERVKKRGGLEIDGVAVGYVDSVGGTQSLNVRPPYFLGGVDKNDAKNVSNNLDGVMNSFVGCIRNVTVSGNSLPDPSLVVDVQPCIPSMEQGAFFYSDGGYVQLTEDAFRVGLDLLVSVEIRPRNLTGVILSVHSGGARDYMVLQIKDGEVIFAADNGQGDMIATYTPSQENQLCDGQWHSIKALKAKHTLILTVDGVSNEFLGKPSSSSTDTTEPLFFGGVPDFGKNGIVADGNYVGCIRNLLLNDEPQFIPPEAISGSVKFDSCPVN